LYTHVLPSGELIQWEASPRLKGWNAYAGHIIRSSFHLKSLGNFFDERLFIFLPLCNNTALVSHPVSGVMVVFDPEGYTGTLQCAFKVANDRSLYRVVP
jgi:hypothetical protein